MAEWPHFDQEVIGCNYNGHYPNQLKSTVTRAPGAAENPILAGVKAQEFTTIGSLYKSLPLVDGVTPLLIGQAGTVKPEPVAWIRTRADGGRVFYTSLGHPGDFEEPAFVTFLRNGILWAAGLPIRP